MLEEAVKLALNAGGMDLVDGPSAALRSASFCLGITD